MKKTSPILAPTGSDKSPAPIPGELCPDEMALLIQVNRRTITRWEKERIISKRGRNSPDGFDNSKCVGLFPKLE